MLTVVMYHYVRRLAESRYPAIKGLEREAFIRQLQHIKATYTPVSGQDVIAAIKGDQLPDDAVLLTFDDGYLDHYTTAFPLLQRERIPAVFFPPARSVLEGVVLDVNKIHYTLACAEPSAIAERIDAAVPDPKAWRAKYAVPSRFDPPEVVYIKRMLQAGLPQPLRGELVAELFARYVTKDERAFGRELYLDEDQLRSMLEAGMMVGSHGYHHEWLNTLSAADQAKEIDQSLAFLRALGVHRDWTMCYPYGAWNDSLIGILRARGCAAGFTTRVAVADLAQDDPLLLPRLDTNDLPS